jgi:GPH family glycoside/pentoside/hexuronide:cation symporter
VSDALAASPAAAAAKLPTRLYLGYGVGMVGGQIFRDAPALLLLFFMTDTLAIPAALAGLAVFLPKLWVVVCDPLVGAWSDRTQSRWGRRRPFVFWGALLSGLTFVALFNVPSFESPTAAAIYMTLIYTLASTAFSLFSIPYFSMATEFTEDTHERTTILAWRVAFTAAGLIAGGVAPYLVARFGGGEGGYAMMALVLGLLITGSMLITFFGTASAPRIARSEAAVPLAQQLRLALANRNYLSLLTINTVQNLGAACNYAAIAYFVKYALGLPLAMLTPLVIVISVAAMAAQPLWVATSKRFGKRAVAMVSLVCYCLSTLAWTRVDGGDTAALYAIAVAVGVFNSGFAMLLVSMLIDAIDEDRKTTGLNREGAFMGVWFALEKAMFAVGALIVSLILAALGFVETAGETVRQPESALRGIVFSFAVLPPLLQITTLVLLWKLKLGRERRRA